jgi:hypothetical protein
VRVGQARKRDVNEKAIVRALRQIGAEVFPLSGRGIPDVLVRYAFEIKSATGKRTEAQVDTQWPVIRSVQEALAAVGVSA